MISGKTTDNKVVVSGVHKFALEMVIERLTSSNLVIDWLDYIECAIIEGAKPKSLYSRIASSVGDVFGPVYRMEIEKRISFLRD